MPVDLDLQIKEIAAGNKQAIARALNLLESNLPEDVAFSTTLIERLSRHARHDRHLIGITGPPGVGKSSLISRMVREYRTRRKTIGIISVDPSSRRSGGALLGDRVRILHDPNDPGVFIRSMAAGRNLGGLAWRTPHCLVVFEAVYDAIIIETVGVGQSETEIDQVADSIVYVVQPGSGDSLQFMKSGIMEIPHILVINKADQKHLAMKARNDLAAVKSFGKADATGWKTQLVLTSALEGWGQEELVGMLKTHREFLETADLRRLRRKNRIHWIFMLFQERFGTYGVEVLGGEAEVLRRIESLDIDNPFDGMKFLADEMRRLAGERFI